MALEEATEYQFNGEIYSECARNATLLGTRRLLAVKGDRVDVTARVACSHGQRSVTAVWVGGQQVDDSFRGCEYVLV